MNTNERDQRMNWWREARFGMFVHWGLYSGLAGTWKGKAVGKSGGMEWIQQRVRADTGTYADAALPLFTPKAGFAKDWTKLAKQAGCRYLVFTTKHHDGFALHDSQASDYDAGSTLHRDLVQEIVNACRAEGLRIGFYHSVIDWHHDQYEYARSKFLPHPLKGKPYPNGIRDHKKYINYLHSQVEELTNNYGPIDIIWWDYSATDFQGKEAWRAFELMAEVRKKHPDIIMNNRLFRIPEAGWKNMKMGGIAPQLDPKYGDFITPEQHVPDNGMPGVDWETCMTMNTTWGFSRHDHQWKSSKQLIHNLIDIVSKGGNYLLNIGPTADGSIPVESTESMQAIGRWMDSNKESIYGCTVCGVAKPNWGRVTQKVDGSAIFLHVFEWPDDGKLELAGLTEKVFKGSLLKNGEKVPVEQKRDQLLVILPHKPVDDIATVIRLDCNHATSP